MKKSFFKPYNYIFNNYHIKIISISEKQILTINSKYIWEIKSGKINGLSFKEISKQKIKLKLFLQYKNPIIVLKNKPYKIYQYINESEIIDISNTDSIYDIPIYIGPNSLNRIKEELI